MISIVSDSLICLLLDSDVGGVVETLAGNALTIAAKRDTLAHILTESVFKKAIDLSIRFTNGVKSIIAELGLPWIVKRLGRRDEYWFRETPSRNGSEAFAMIDSELDRYMHLYSINRGILMKPVHNIALFAPDTTKSDVDYHTQVFREAVIELIGS